MGSDVPVSGSGAIARITWRLAADAMDGSSAPIALVDAQLNDVSGRDFATSAVQATIARTDGLMTIVDNRVFLPLVTRDAPHP